MPKYLFTANYTTSGVKGILAEGGTAREKVVERLAKSLNGKLECQYWAFGKYDYVAIADLPDNAAAAALSLTVSATGSVAVSTTALLTAKEVDEATKRGGEYRAPGAKAK